MATGDPLLVVHHGARGAVAGLSCELLGDLYTELFLGWVKPTPKPLVFTIQGHHFCSLVLDVFKDKGSQMESFAP